MKIKDTKPAENVNLTRDRKIRVSAQKRRGEILWYLKNFGGGSVDGYCKMFGTFPNVVSGRFTELTRAGLITKTSEKVATRSGSMANIYTISL